MLLAEKEPTIEIETGIGLPEAFTVPEVEKALKVSRSTVYALINSGELMCRHRVFRTLAKCRRRK